VANGGNRAGFGEVAQGSFALDDAPAFHRLMLGLYGDHCAVTGHRPDEPLDVFIFQPVGHGGALSPANAIVVEAAVASLLGRGLILISDDYMAYTPNPEIIGETRDPDAQRGRRLSLPADVSLWPRRDMLFYHRSLFRAQ
jgi:hypothetical protein